MKALLTLLASIFGKSSLETGRELLQTISELIHHVLTTIDSSPQSLKQLKKAIKLFDPSQRIKPLSVSRQAIEDNLPQDTKAHLDQHLQANYVSCMKKLNQFHARSKEVVLAIDDTPEAASSKHMNNQYSYKVIGQQKIWKRAFNYSAIYDCTHQLFLSFLHRNYHASKHKRGQLQPFIRQLQDACRAVEKAGSQVKYIDADRGYFDAELFAAAFFEKIGAKCKYNPQPLTITPKKFTRSKAAKKRAFLENSEAKQVQRSTIGLTKHTHPALIKDCKEHPLVKKQDGSYRIPVIEVAMVDEYSRKNHRSLNQLRKEWQQTKANIRNSRQRLNRLQSKYMEAQRRQNVQKPKYIKRITKRVRTKFRSQALKTLYFQLRKTLIYIKSLKKAQKKMLKSLMFFTISTTPSRLKRIKSAPYVNLARIYHERWGIENGFKEEKAKFIRKCRSRKPTQRQLNFLFGLIIYNHWHCDRMGKMLQKERKLAWNKVPWVPYSPFLRRKFERVHGNLLSAESYVLQIFQHGIKARLSEILSG